MSLQKQLLNSAVKSVGERQIKVIVSDATQDRSEDIIDPMGIDYASYLKNPVVLYQHDHDQPIARCISLSLEGGKLHATVEFPPEGELPKSDEVYKLIKNGILNAASIGFIPKEYVWLEDSRWGRKFTSVEMIEFSFVSVPCNPNALITERSAPKGQKGGGADTNESPAPDNIAELHTITPVGACVLTIKAGRTISAANEAKLREAYKTIGEVLAQVEEPAPSTPEEPKGVSKARFTAEFEFLALKAVS